MKGRRKEKYYLKAYFKPFDVKKTARFVRKVRKKLGLSQGELAILFGRARSTLSKWENGQAICPGDIILGLQDLVKMVERGEFKIKRKSHKLKIVDERRKIEEEEEEELESVESVLERKSLEEEEEKEDLEVEEYIERLKKGGSL